MTGKLPLTLFPAHTDKQDHIQQTRHIDPMLDQCWVDVVNGGQTLGRCGELAGYRSRFKSVLKLLPG